MKTKEIADTLASLFERRSLQHYVRWKVRADPIYASVAERLRDRSRPVLDVGCGIGLLSYFLRESGVASPVLGIDFDERKIELARRAARDYSDLEFEVRDARTPFPGSRDVVILDILQYFPVADHATILTNAAKAAGEGGIVVIRTGIRDSSWSYRLTWLADLFGRAISWMRAESLTHPTREAVLAPFAAFDQEVIPLRGRTPFNNYLFVFTPPKN